MARSILAIAQEAAEREATAPAPASLFGTNDRIAKIVRGAAKDTTRDLLRRSSWWGLSEWHATWVWATQPGRYAYPLPPDFLRVIERTEQRGGWPLGLVGPATPQAWAAWMFGGAATAGMGWRIRNGLLWLEPVPTAAELVAIDYVSRYPVVSAVRAGDYNLATTPLQTFVPFVPREGWLALPDDSLLAEEAADDGRFEGEDPGWDEGTWAQEPHEVLRRLYPLSAEAPLPQVRRPEFAADGDQPAFEDDYLLSLGITFRLRRALGLPFAEQAAEYEHEMMVRLAEDAGGARSFRLGGEAAPCDALPLGGGRWLVS